MKSVQVKYRDGTKWKLLPAKEMLNNSIASYMALSDRHLVAAMFDGMPEDNKPILFVTNMKEDIEKYKERALTIHIDDLIGLFDNNKYPPLYVDAVKVFDEYNPQYGTICVE